MAAQAPPRISKLLEAKRYLVLVSALSHTFMTVEPPPHTDALQLSARSDELSMRTIFSMFTSSRLIVSLATNSLVNLCDEPSGEVCTGSRGRRGEALKLLRTPRRSSRWAIERVA